MLDFDSRMCQYTDDLANLENCRKHEKLLREADIIFIDAMKDAMLEYAFWKNFQQIGLKEGCLIIFDDIRLWNMVEFWRSIEMPKLDLTSFGHWTGTGIVHWR